MLRALKNTSSGTGGFLYCFNLDFEGVGASGSGGGERKKEIQGGGLARFIMSNDKEEEEAVGIVYTPALLDGDRDGGGDLFRRVVAMERLECLVDNDKDGATTATATATLKSKDKVQKGQIDRLLRLSSTMYQSLLANAATK